MKQFVLAMLVGVSLIAVPAHAYTVRRHDCQGVAEYVGSNLGNAILLGRSLAPTVTTVASLWPDGQGQVGFDYVGIGLSVLKGFVQVGGSPRGAANLVLGFVCLEIASDDEVAADAAAAEALDGP